MNRGQFSSVAANPSNTIFEKTIIREFPLYRKADEIRSDFERDYNRILHSFAYRRLKHKTQVFYATMNDHICTRIEHTQHVAAVAGTICNFLGLNRELASAIALGHDLGHPPFGHEGEKVISGLSQIHLGKPFWHEKNSLKIIDEIETLLSTDGTHQNLNLTYAVRDGIISHCGEIDENAISPREQTIDLNNILYPNQYAPYSWEACVVKISDKIAYLGRDIEDAIMLGILNQEQLKELESIVRRLEPNFNGSIGTTGIMHNLIINLCQNSSVNYGLCFDNTHYAVISAIKKFNYQNIYRHPRVNRFNEFAKLVIHTIFHALMDWRMEHLSSLKSFSYSSDNLLYSSFYQWIIKYSTIDKQEREIMNYKNRIVFDFFNDQQFIEYLLIYISLMSDQHILKVYNDIIKY